MLGGIGSTYLLITADEALLLSSFAHQSFEAQSS